MKMVIGGITQLMEVGTKAHSEPLFFTLTAKFVEGLPLKVVVSQFKRSNL